MRNLPKLERITIRTTQPEMRLLQEAARASHKSVSDFLRDAGVTAAAEMLANRRHCVLDQSQWQAFQEALDRPVQEKRRLKQLLHGPGIYRQ